MKRRDLFKGLIAGALAPIAPAVDRVEADDDFDWDDPDDYSYSPPRECDPDDVMCLWVRALAPTETPLLQTINSAASYEYSLSWGVE
jgi:hypothetical protein